MISAALVITPPVLDESLDDGVGVGRTVQPRLANTRDDEDLVVHREPEQHREEEDRHPTFDLAHVIGPKDARADAESKDDDEQSVGRRRP